MKRTALRWFVLSIGIYLGTTVATAASRPHYGGVLHVETRAAASDLSNPVRPLVYENLTGLDESGRPQPQLAVRWEAQNGNRRWQFWLRSGVRFHDDAPLNAATAAASLAACSGGAQAGTARPGCEWLSVRANGDSLVFEFGVPRPHFAAELALVRYAIEHTSDSAQPAGTGPYRWGEARGTTIALQANEDYWGGRPFIDTIELKTSRPLRDQMASLGLGRADLIETGPEQLRRMTKERTAVSQPATMLALVVRSSKPALLDARLREAIALSIDRASISKVLLNNGEVSGGLLPNWLSGYAFLFPQNRDLGRAQQLVKEAANALPLTIGTANADPGLQLVVERIAVNARDAGLTLQPTSNPAQADLLLTQVDLASIDATVALTAMADALGLERQESEGSSPQKLFEEERAILTQRNVIPLAYIPRIAVLGPRLRNWTSTPDGRWHLEQVWLAPGEGGR